MQLRGRTPGGDAWGPPPPALPPHVLRDVEHRVPWPLIGWREPPRLDEDRGWQVATAPSFQAVGTLVGGNTSQSPAWPTHITNDVGYLLVFSNDPTDGAGTPVLSVAAGFVAVPSGSANSLIGGARYRETAFWCRATSAAMTAPTVSITGSGGLGYSHITAVIITVRNAILTGDPTEATSLSSNATSNASLSIPAGTTLGPQRLVLVSAGSRDLVTASGWANAGLTGVAEVSDQGTASDGAQWAATGTCTAAGSWGTTTATISSATPWVGLALAVMPQADAAPARIPPARADGRVWLKPGFGNVVRGSTEQNNGVAGSVPAPGFIAKNPRPYLAPGFGTRVQGSTQARGAGVDAPPTPRPIPANVRPWLKPGFGRRVEGSTVNQLPQAVRGASYWGPHFPRRRNGPRTFWNGHFPDGIPTTVPGVNPAGAGTFALTLENDAKVSYAWQTGLFKSYSGLERRSNIVDDPAQRFEGVAILAGDQTRAARARLARYAALGTPFLLGLPYESLAITADSTGTTVTVNTTTLSDWAVPGQRVVVKRARAAGVGGVLFDSVEAVIQSVTATTIVVDVTLGNTGLIGAEIMPTVAVYLDAQQALARYRTPGAVERWNVKARNVNAGFLRSATWASITLTGSSAGITFRAWDAGSAGNSLTVKFIADATADPFVEVVGNALTYHYRSGIDTVATMVGAIERNGLFYVTGPRPLTVMTGADAFGPTALSGGLDAGPVPVGIGATVTTFASVPVWDRRLDNPDTVTDSINSFAVAQDLGGLPFVAGMSSQADWGRDITLVAQIGAEWQWAKKFLDTVRGRWKSFWLPTWRADLVATASGVGTLTISTGENAGDVFAWYPAQRQYLQLWQADGTVTYARITAAVDNGGGTATLTIVDGSGSPVTLSGSAIVMVSWLERVRLEDDTVAVGFADFNFKLQLTARVVQQATELTPEASFIYDESGVETSRPREGIEIRINDLVVYRIATGTRDVTIGGLTFTAGPAARAELGIAAVGDDEQALDVTLPAVHPVAQRYFAIGVPPKQILVNIWRKQTTSAAEETAWRGVVTSIAPGEHVVRLRVLSRMSLTVARRLPTITAGRDCPHILYDDNCKVDRTSASASTTVTGINGRVVTVALSIPTADFFTFGEIVHSASGERMTIQSQTGSTITMQLPIYGMAIGDAVALSPGCDHSITTCNAKYSNRDNFGGFPQLPRRNPFKNAKLGGGVVEQT
jgi:uncharacterized phage protein (TIGR02218 family)